MARRITILFFCLLIPGPAHADPILTPIIAGALVSAGLGATAAAITASALVVIGGAAVAVGVTAIASSIGKRKSPSLGSYSFADSAGGRVTVAKSSVESHKVIYGRVRVSGPLVYVTTTNQTVYVANVESTVVKKSNLLHMVIPLACHEVEEIETIYLNEEALTLDGSGRATGKWVTTYPRSGGTSYHVTVKKHLGSPDQTVDPDLLAVATEWTAVHRLRGIAYIYVQLRYFGYNTNVGAQSLFPSGVPNISAIVKGKKVYDPRTGLTVYSNNWALCMRDYLTNSDYGLGATDAEIDDDSVIASANICDENVSLAGGGTQKRYTCDGQIDTANAPLENIKDLVTAGAGAIPYTQGKFRVFAGAYTTPSADVDETWLAGELEVQAKTPRSELFNAVKGVYVSPDKSWQPTDFPMVTNATYETQDGGIQIPKDLELPYTIDSIRAQRIAKIVLEKARQGIAVKMPCNWKALQLAIYDTVTVSIDKLGWSSKVFRVTGWEISPEVVINVTLQEESSASYDWASGEATTYDAAPDTNLPDAGTVDAPGNPVITESLYETTDGSGIKTQASLTWAESESPFISHYLVQYKLSSEADEQYRQEPPIYGNQHTIRDIATGVWDFRVRAINLKGASSDYATTRREIYGLSAPPSDITGLTITIIAQQAHLSWTQHPDLDVRNGGYIRLRWSPSVTSATWSDAIDIVDAMPGVTTHLVVPAQTGTYLVKAYDSSGHESINANSIILNTNPDTLVLSSAVTFTEYNGVTQFPGTKTNLVSFINIFPSSPDYGLEYLELAGLVNFEDIAGNFDSASGYFDAGSGGGFVSSGEYIRSTFIDLQYVYTFNLAINAIASVFDATSYFDQADGLFDDREGLFNGVDRSQTFLETWVKTTNSNPTGSTSPNDAIWSDWQKFFAADFTARAIWTKIVVQNDKLSNSLTFRNINPSLKFPYREQRFISQSLAAGGTTMTYSLPFRDKPTVSVMIQSPQSGDTPKITHTVSGLYTAVTVQILNGGSGVSRTVDVIARGY